MLLRDRLSCLDSFFLACLVKHLGIQEGWVLGLLLVRLSGPVQVDEVNLVSCNQDVGAPQIAMNPSVVVHQLDALAKLVVETSVLGLGGAEVLTIFDVIHHCHMPPRELLPAGTEGRGKLVVSKETVKASGVWSARELDHVLLRGVFLVMSKEDKPLLLPQVRLKDEFNIIHLGDVREVEMRLSEGRELSWFAGTKKQIEHSPQSSSRVETVAIARTPP